MPWSLPELPPDFDYPLPPRIKDIEIRKLVFTLKEGSVSSAGIESPQRDNEKLEHQGDAILGCIITILLQDLFPDLKTGHASDLKGQLVSNAVLAQVSTRYGLPNRLLGNPHTLPSARASTKIQANVFEAYIGGLYRDIRKSHEGSSDSMVLGPAIDPIATWLVDLYTPLAQWAEGLMEEYYGPGWNDVDVEEVDDPDTAVALVPQTDWEVAAIAQGATARLNAYMVQVKAWPVPTYDAQWVNENTWRVLCTVIDGSGAIKMTQVAEGRSKKIASMVAAWRICRQLGLM